MIANAAIDALNAALASTNGEPITFTSGKSKQSVSDITAVRGRSVVNISDTNGAIIQVSSIDWIIMAPDIAALGSGGKYIPSKGDFVTDANGSIYELMAPSYSPSDHAFRRLRLHSVQTQ